MQATKHFDRHRSKVVESTIEPLEGHDFLRGISHTLGGIAPWKACLQQLGRSMGDTAETGVRHRLGSFLGLCRPQPKGRDLAHAKSGKQDGDC